jgi:hypothetical protein
MSKLETIKHVNNQLLIETIHKRDWPLCCSIAYNDAAFVSIPDKDNNLPIHLAVSFGCTNQLLELFLRVFPLCIKMKDSRGNLPLHLAVHHNRNRLWINIGEISTTLINAYPQALQECDAYNNLPLHIALRSRGPDELVNFLLLVYPAASHAADQYLNTIALGSSV